MLILNVFLYIWLLDIYNPFNTLALKYEEQKNIYCMLLSSHDFFVVIRNHGITMIFIFTYPFIKNRSINNNNINSNNNNKKKRRIRIIIRKRISIYLQNNHWYLSERRYLIYNVFVWVRVTLVYLCADVIIFKVRYFIWNIIKYDTRRSSRKMRFLFSLEEKCFQFVKIDRQICETVTLQQYNTYHFHEIIISIIIIFRMLFCIQFISHFL